MKRKLFLFGLILLVLPLIQSCQESSALSKPKDPGAEVDSNEHLMMAVLYTQTAAEYRALCYQAFNIARLQLDNSLKIMGLMKQQAIVVDIDETVLDNSPYEAKCILDNIFYPAYWDEWMNKSDAKPVPGALDFLKYAESKKIEVYYVTNRKEKYRQQTLNNLQQAGFPFADNEHLMMKTEESSKESRRKKIMETQAIIILIGDNLNDFSDVFEKKTIPERFEMTDELKTEFGKRFIVLPNAMYGDWENAIYNYSYDLSPTEKSGARHEHLQGF
ncbi:MAG: 5'-nucleotidase, lipoprotein e(P4) family [Bacteroidales bacterium]|nr:5'-nucleotidase, lipoprotein e(P4) family [Bacteroidales bacterium]